MSVSYNPKIITDGLVLCLDAANKKSYPGSGTTWTDLSGNSNNGTLSGSVTFNSSNIQSMSYLSNTSITTFTSAPSFYTNYTIESIFTVSSFRLINGLGDGHHVIGWGKDATSERRALILWNDGTANVANFTIRSSSYGSNPKGNTPLITNRWYYAAVSLDSGGNAKIYLNGQLDGTGTNTLKTPTSNDLRIGSDSVGTTREYLNGNISVAKIYNRVLSDAEIQQNFNATRGRYGI